MIGAINMGKTHRIPHRNSEDFKNKAKKLVESWQGWLNLKRKNELESMAEEIDVLGDLSFAAWKLMKTLEKDFEKIIENAADDEEVVEDFLCNGPAGKGKPIDDSFNLLEPPNIV